MFHVNFFDQKYVVDARIQRDVVCLQFLLLYKWVNWFIFLTQLSFSRTKRAIYLKKVILELICYFFSNECTSKQCHFIQWTFFNLILIKNSNTFACISNHFYLQLTIGNNFKVQLFLIFVALKPFISKSIYSNVKTIDLTDQKRAKIK